MHFVRVTSKEKGCPAIIDMEKIIEIVPHKNGGTVLFFVSPETLPTYVVGVNVSAGRHGIHVEEEFKLFEQFVIQTVSSEDIAKISKVPHKEKFEIPKL